MTHRAKTALILGPATLTMFIPLAMALAGYQIPMFQHLGFERGSLATPVSWILAIAVGAGYIIYTLRVLPFVAKMQREISLFKLLGILAAIIGGIVEEVCFRRWLMDILMAGGFGATVQVVVSGLSFGLAHASWLLFKRDRKFALPAVMSTSILGILLAVIYLLGGRNLGPCIFAHSMINVVVEPWLMLAAVSGSWKTGSADQA